MSLRMTGEIKVSLDRFRWVFVVFLYVTKVFSDFGSLSRRSSVSPLYNFLQRVQVIH